MLRRYIKEYVTCHTCRCLLSHNCLSSIWNNLLQIAGHDPEQGDAVVLPAVHDLPLLLQRADHQDRFPGDLLSKLNIFPHTLISSICQILCLRLSPAREGYSERKPPRSTSRLPRSSPWSSWLCLPLHLSLFNWLGLWNLLRTTPCWSITRALFSQNQWYSEAS